MSITPPSDLVLDVAQAIEPSQYYASIAKLQSTKTVRSLGSSPKPEMAFEDFVTTAQRNHMPLPVATAQLDHMRPPVAIKTAIGPQEAYRKFEGLMLQNVLDAMLTSETTSVFGKEAGAGYWKSLMTEAMANEMSQAGGIGLADMMEERRTAVQHIGRTIAATANVAVHQSQMNLIHHLNKGI